MALKLYKKHAGETAVLQTFCKVLLPEIAAIALFAHFFNNYKLTGNSVAIPVMQAVAGEIIKTLNERKKPHAGEQLTLLEPKQKYEHSGSHSSIE